MKPKLSFVIPTYNRRALLPAAVDSALAWLDVIGAGEIVIVDDGSTDDTAAMVADRYGERIARGDIRFHVRDRNGGVGAAKNSGADLARGDWIVFLDSDDEMIADAAEAAVRQLQDAGDAPVVFFRCLDMSTGLLIGAPLGQRVRLDLERFAWWTWGECLAAVRPEAARAYPYPADLGGFEGLSYFRMIGGLGELIVTPVVARRYRTVGDDRVSVRSRRRRSRDTMTYATIMLREFGSRLSRRVRLLLYIIHLKARVRYWVAGGAALFRSGG